MRLPLRRRLVAAGDQIAHAEGRWAPGAGVLCAGRHGRATYQQPGRANAALPRVKFECAVW